jgi:magnesium-transporting ATPase (P-type)
VNFFSDSFPAIALAFEELRDTTRRSTARGTHVILTNEVRFLVFGLGLLASILLFVLYHMLLALEYDPVIVRAFIFAAFSSGTLFMAFSLRSLHQSILTYNPLGNWYLTAGVGIGLVLTLGALYFPPLQEILGTTPLPWPWLLGVLGFGLLMILMAEVVKWAFKNSDE